MSKYIDADKLIAEIKRRKKQDITFRERNILVDIEVCIASLRADMIIASLQQEKPGLPGIEDPGIPGKDFIPVEWVEACEEYGKWKIVKQNQPEVDLEEEMQEEYYKYAIYENGSISGEGYQLEAQGHYECNLTRKEFKDIARHFYELGLNARREE